MHHISAVELAGSIDAFQECRVLILGDVMLDSYLFGDANRISPEAPVPVVSITGTKQLVGGAGNVARNIKALGGVPIIVGVTGNDAPGDYIARSFTQEGIHSGVVATSERPTIVKTRVLAQQQQMLRFDQEDLSPLSQETVDSILHTVSEKISGCAAVVISDYNKGFFSPDLVLGLKAILARQKKTLPVLVDPKPENMNLFSGVTVLTPNAKETREISGLPLETAEEIVRAGRRVIERQNSEYLLVTLGARGMALFSRDGDVWHIPTSAREVFDVTGAGDTVIATLALALAAKVAPLQGCMLANFAAGQVIGEVGVATISASQLAETVMRLPIPDVRKWA